mmetsp:Transcript_29709/g.48321  ORF Transcript_29709/g.48321 Transcript_29709/m.48321 type:complete len:105 (-) Transcript_29709:266-580(-)
MNETEKILILVLCPQAGRKTLISSCCTSSAAKEHQFCSAHFSPCQPLAGSNQAFRYHHLYWMPLVLKNAFQASSGLLQFFPSDFQSSNKVIEFFYSLLNAIDSL